MVNTEIFFSVDSEESEYESINKGYRLDVFVKLHECLYQVAVYTIVRLQQDFDTEISDSGFYLPDTNLIFAKESSKDEIVKTINWLVGQKYFEKLKSLSNTDIVELVKVQ